MKKAIWGIVFILISVQVSLGGEIWSEDFESYTSGTGIEGPGTANIGDYPGSVTKWSLDVAATDLDVSTGYIKTVSGKLECQDPDGPVIWLSEEIDISLYASVSFSLEATEVSDLEGTDFFDVEYAIDGGSFSLLANWNGKGDGAHTLIGDLPDDNDWGTEYPSVTGISGNTLQIRVTLNNNAATEQLQLDNIIVAEDILPVELSSFFAETTKEGIILHWSTASQLNNAGFYIYKNDLRIGQFILGDGTTNQLCNYTYLDVDVIPGVLYTYRLSDIEEGTGLETFHPEISVVAGKGMVNVGDTPYGYMLHKNHPNPFNPITTISFDLPESVHLHLAIYDATGKLIRTFSDGRTWDEGMHSVVWNGKDDGGNDVTSGTYFCKMTTENFNQTQSLILLK